MPGFQTLTPLKPRQNGQVGFAGQGTGQSSMRPANTFAGMQQRGVARPAPQRPANSYYQTPQPAAPAPGANGPGPNTYATYSTPNDPNRGALQDAVAKMLAQPSAYSTDQLKRDYGTLNDQLALDSAEGKRKIDETMASRGLHASTLTGDAYGNLEKQQGVTRQQFANNYLDREASDLATARANAISAALGVQQENANESLAEFGANQASQNQAHNQSMDVAKLGESRYEFDQGNALDRDKLALDRQTQLGQLGVSQQQASTAAAAQRATEAYQTGQLGLSNRQLDSQNVNAAADRAQQLAMQGNELTFNREKLASDNTNTQADLALRQMLGLGQLGVDQGNLQLNRDKLSSDNTNAVADRAQRAKEAADQLGLNYAQLSQSDRQFLASLNLDTQKLSSSNFNASADRALQQDLGYKADTRKGEEIAANKELAQNQLMMQVATLLGINKLGTWSTDGSTGSSSGGSAPGGGYGYSPGVGSSGIVDDPNAGGRGTDGANANIVPTGGAFASSNSSNGGGIGEGAISFGGMNFAPSEFLKYTDQIISGASGGVVNFGGKQYTVDQFRQLQSNAWNNYATQQLTRQNAAANPTPQNVTDPNATYTPVGNDYGFKAAGGHTLADWQAYQGSEGYKAAKWATDHPGQPYNASSGAAFNPGDGRTVAQYIKDAGFDAQNVQVGNDGSIMDATTGATLQGPATSATQPNETESPEAIAQRIALARYLGIDPREWGLDV